MLRRLKNGILHNRLRLLKDYNYKSIDISIIKILYDYILDRKISNNEAKNILLSIKERHLSKKQLIAELVLSPEFLRNSIQHAQDFHLNFIHFARIKMVSTLIPEAKNIVDLGGANCSIYEMGYPYKFKNISIVDLPPQERHEMYKERKLKPIVTPQGPIHIVLCSMTDLSAFGDNTIDLVWSGQSIEHITEEDSKIVYKEVMRILRRNGYFCLDTPNRLLTEIHTGNKAIFINPDHKIEYYPSHIRQNLVNAGFKIIEEYGICEMRNTHKTKKIDYADFIIGNPISSDVNSSYIQYYKSQKR